MQIVAFGIEEGRALLRWRWPGGRSSGLGGPGGIAGIEEL